jgi:hypothetical protein
MRGPLCVRPTCGSRRARTTRAPLSLDSVLAQVDPSAAFTLLSSLSTLLSSAALTKRCCRRWAPPSFLLPYGPPLLPFLLCAGGAGANALAPSSPSTLSPSRVLTLCLSSFFLFFFFFAAASLTPCCRIHS